MRFFVILSQILSCMVLIRSFIGLLWCIVFFFTAVICSLLLFKPKIAIVWGKTFWAPIFNYLVGVKVSVEGLENVPNGEKPFIVFVNHQSYIDIPVCLEAIPNDLYFVLKEELRHMPLVGWFSRYVGMVFVSRENSQKAKKSLETVAQIIRAGKHVLIYPEGTRSEDGKVGKIKMGGISLASAAQVPILPIAIDGTQVSQKKGGFLIKPAKVHVQIGKAFYVPETIDEQNITEIRADVHQTLENLHQIAIEKNKQ